MTKDINESEQRKRFLPVALCSLPGGVSEDLESALAWEEEERGLVAGAC